MNCKPCLGRLTLWVGGAFCLASSAAAQVVLFAENALIPDDNSVGYASIRTLDSATNFGQLESVSISLSGVGEGMFNGDIYSTLTHVNSKGEVDGFVVLLNRVGVRNGDLFGYGDNGMRITLRDSALLGDVHRYRFALGGDDDLPILGPLVGTWQPDGRSQDPMLVRETDPRTTRLSAFSGVNPGEGQWILFTADVFGGRVAQLDNWSMTFSPAAIPEPASQNWIGMFLAAAAIVRVLRARGSFVLYRRKAVPWDGR